MSGVGLWSRFVTCCINGLSLKCASCGLVIIESLIIMLEAPVVAFQTIIQQVISSISAEALRFVFFFHLYQFNVWQCSAAWCTNSKFCRVGKESFYLAWIIYHRANPSFAIMSQQQQQVHLTQFASCITRRTYYLQIRGLTTGSQDSFISLH